MAEPVLQEIAGPFDGATQLFTLAQTYFPSSVHMYLNGQLLTASDSDGWFEVLPNQVRMKIAPKSGDTLHAYYQTEPPVGGGFLPPPIMTALIELRPRMIRATDLRAIMLSAEEI